MSVLCIRNYTRNGIYVPTMKIKRIYMILDWYIGTYNLLFVFTLEFDLRLDLPSH